MIEQERKRCARRGRSAHLNGGFDQRCAKCKFCILGAIQSNPRFQVDGGEGLNYQDC
jgi:hypothetical protein